MRMLQWLAPENGRVAENLLRLNAQQFLTGTGHDPALGRTWKCSSAKDLPVEWIVQEIVDYARHPHQELRAAVSRALS
jgi:hypothetical protein